MMTHIVATGLTLTIFLFHRIEATFISFEHLFGNASAKDFQFYWNVPTFMCHQYGIQFEEVSRDFGIIQNPRDQFRGEKIAILYDPGMFPALVHHPDGVLTKRNGGVPQEGDLNRHLEVFRKHLIEQITNESFAGVGIIDFESWRPIFRQNWASLDPYRVLSVKLERERHPLWSDQAVKKEAFRRFEKWGRMFMEETLKAAKELRPRATWGYYAYPYCFNLTPNQPNFACDRQVVTENNKISWLFKAENVLLPSVYLRNSLTDREKIGLINGRVSEAMRISRRSSPRTKVLPYFWYKYQDQTDILLNGEVTVNGFREIVDLAADGVIIWGSSNDLNSSAKCQKFREYLKDILGPAVVEAKAMAKRRVSNDENAESLQQETELPTQSISTMHTR